MYQVVAFKNFLYVYNTNKLWFSILSGAGNKLDHGTVHREGGEMNIQYTVSVE